MKYLKQAMWFQEKQDVQGRFDHVQFDLFA